ncbi:MAG: hypothetical protein AAFO95_06725 [Cyanobacteria bacterium J06600_6]
MNFDRNYTITNSTVKHSQELIGRIQKLPVVKRVYLYILLMTAIGVGMGEAKYRFESKNCMAKDQVLRAHCWTIQPAQRRVRELGTGAIAGMITATLISLPALLEET